MRRRMDMGAPHVRECRQLGEGHGVDRCWHDMLYSNLSEAGT
jgi:hypothetical protein